MDAPSAASTRDPGGEPPAGAPTGTAAASESGSSPPRPSSEPSPEPSPAPPEPISDEPEGATRSPDSADPTPLQADKPADSGSAGAPRGVNIGWASDALVLTALVGIAAKLTGVIVAPGMRGVALQATMETTEVLTATVGYTFAALLVALICGGSFELARARTIGVTSRSLVVAVSGLIVALASPAVVQRLHSFAALACAAVTSLIALVAGVVALRAAHTRATGAVLTMLGFCGLARPAAWMIVGVAGERASISLYQVGRGLGTAAIVVHALATLLAAVWLAKRSLWRGRLLANSAVILAFALTYLAARETDGPPSAAIAVLRSSLLHAAGNTVSFGVGAIAAFLVPASILLAAVALVQRESKAVTVALSLALLSGGAFDVPLQALAVTAAAQWILLGMADPRAMWTSLVAARVSTPTTR